MTEQRKSVIKLISAIIIILLLPVLFFRFIGDDPTKQKINATRQIAVVNEDTGLLNEEVSADEEDEQSAQFGKEVAAVLGERPDYSWTVVNRSAAETGLASKKYDAVVYIPSDFSKNILSYDQERPQKATLEFSIQDNLNAVNKEKVQRELEDAQKSMNKKMSTLYWNFVSQKVDNVREEFDNIVNKESEFQNVMYNFYKPSSNDLAGEIKRQKDLIDELKKSMNEAQGTTKEKATTADEAKSVMKDFVETVEKYKQYQENQKKLLLAAQDSNQKQIQTGLDAIKAQQAANQFSEMMSGLSTGISQVKTQLGQTSSALAATQKVREAQVPEQEAGIRGIQNNLIDMAVKYHLDSRKASLNQVQQQIINARPALIVEPGEDNEEKEKEKLKIDLENQRDELKNIAAEIKEISESLKEPETEEPQPENPDPDNGNEADPDDQKGNTGEKDSSSDTENDDQTDNETQDSDQNQENSGDSSENSETKSSETDGVVEQTATSGSLIKYVKLANEDETEEGNDSSELEKIKEQLNNASNQIQQIEEQIQKKENDHNEELKKRLEQLHNKIEKTKKEVKETHFQNIYQYIYDLEKEAGFTGLPENFETDSINKLMSYSNLLSIYQSIRNDSFSIATEKDEFINSQQGKVTSILAIKPEETASWENLKNNTMATDEDIDNFIEGMTEFASNYSNYIRDEQSGVLDELSKISESAANASDQLTNGAAQEAATFNDGGLSGTMALTVQDTVGQEVLQISGMMGSLSDRQSGIIDYTSNMQESVNEVQTKADTLNNNWGKNVDSTKLVRKDVYGILGNTLVDGQNNGYVYDYLANPLKISGEVPEERTQTVPPVVILVIILISSLLIGYFSSYYQNAPILVKGALFGILNILVGLMISLFGLNIYSLPDDQTIQWSIFTILLLVASSAFIRAAFMFGSIAGWIASSAMILFYVAPLIDLVMPNFSFDNPVSKVYIDIQYGTGHLFTMGITALLIITLITVALPLVIRLMADKTAEIEETHDV
ncbi:type VII secretion protein EsaA [Bacillus atrophaeus]|uniref:type VII secretion protein EsaA n=1 Tax=Bacillus atrophaeus TaxID=1452 RepID=UPI002E21D1DD|nr:type VII secretion protein EsaA [Bacillus atrophaeus]MED1028960.1 type VII secretion protein EsaA [Bacillus atrophaeus]MED1118706.1 type VII secretion protein EsaA [Bacillus atrophaeus]MED1131970.1 type VII secretion protein EsaA [Bacillus atrophaeus]